MADATERHNKYWDKQREKMEAIQAEIIHRLTSHTEHTVNPSSSPEFRGVTIDGVFVPIAISEWGTYTGTVQVKVGAQWRTRTKKNGDLDYASIVKEIFIKADEIKRAKARGEVDKATTNDVIAYLRAAGFDTEQLGKDILANRNHVRFGVVHGHRVVNVDLTLEVETDAGQRVLHDFIDFLNKRGLLPEEK